MILMANLPAVYMEYAKTSNLVAVAIYLTTLVAAQTAHIGMFSPSHDPKR